MSDIKQHLLNLGNGTVQPEDTSEGVCFEIKQKFGGETMERVMNLIKEWPYHSGDSLFPVPDPDGLVTPKMMYTKTRNHWKGSYGTLRRDLCLWLADRV